MKSANFFRKSWMMLVIGLVIGLAVGLPLGGKLLFRPADSASNNFNQLSLNPPANSAAADMTVNVGQAFQLRPTDTYYVLDYDKNFLTYESMETVPWTQSSYQWVHNFRAIKATTQPTYVLLRYPIINGHDYQTERVYSINISEEEKEKEKGELAIYRRFTNQYSSLSADWDAYLTGEIKLLPFKWTVNNFKKCNGAQLNTADYPALFSLIGNQFGGDGSKTFALPSIPFVAQNGPYDPLSDLNYQVCTNGTPPGANPGPADGNIHYHQIAQYYEFMLGEIILAKNVKADDAYWLIPCDGAVLSINSYTALFSLVGTYYGGNGYNTFAVPDMRGVPSPIEGAGFYIVKQGIFPARE